MAWWVDKTVGATLGTLEAAFAMPGRRVGVSSMGEVVYADLAGQGYYIKRYHRAGGHLQAWVGQPRVEREWRNLRRFQQWGLNVPEVVAYGQQRRAGHFQRGALVTRALDNSVDLATLARHADPRLGDPRWRDRVSRQVARALAVLHGHRFCHGDMKWRNVLVTDDRDRVFLIDCPSGRFWWGPMLRYRRIKDLACLDKVARHQLSRSERLRFYLRYRGIARLGRADKREVRKVLGFFQGRD
ncbi:lipopolysaccharide kinase InaA family protein [Alloalcanivorax mobilis]|uniref:lipopolysaccharide kinase InaA family protein n=1 Tax=Alloalcanivorax mobilis TaxID=2019569 RepID=UPI000C7819F7|nr:lipopolysaccharide kinase InaA family protein [Alloalcanivorax mobilis]